MNRVSVSQIAWRVEQEYEALALLARLGISNLEVAPGILFEDPTSVSDDEINKVKKLWENKGFSLKAMQGLMFGRNDLQLFGENTGDFVNYLSKIIYLAGKLGVGPLVFGCPSNRTLREGYTRDNCLDVFHRLGSIAEQNGTYFCIEPNAKEYGTNFINDVDEAINLVADVNHPHFKMILDTSTIILTGDDVVNAIKRAESHFIHFHISAPMLVPISELQIDHKKIAKQLNEIGYDGLVSVEMVSGKNPDDLKGLEKCLAPIVDIYGRSLK